MLKSVVNKPIRQISDLLHGMTRDEFFRDYFEKKPMFFDRKDPSYYDGLLELDDLEFLIETDLDHISTVSATDEEGRRSGFSGGAKHSYMEQVYDKLHGGHSIVLDALQVRHPPLKDMCIALQAETMYRFQCNIYITPPAARAFKLHFDGHDVFILQTHGVKKWFVDSELLSFPIEGDHYEGPDSMEGRTFTEHMMTKGDMIFVPKGFLHRAESSDTEFSIHVTLGFHPPTWYRLLTQVIDSASRKHQVLREAIPMMDLASGGEKESRKWAKMIAEFIDEDFIANELRDFPHLWSDRLDGQFSGQFLSAINFLSRNNEKSYRGNHSIPVQQYDEDENFVLRFYGKEVRFPAGAANAVSFCLQDKAFALSDIPDLDDDESRQVLIERLVREGLVLVDGQKT